MDLITMTKKGDSASCERALLNGAFVNARDKAGYTPLHWACQEGREEIVKLLLRFGADVDEQDAERFTPLEVAINGGHPIIAALLINKNADLRRTRDGFSYLHAAAAAGDIESMSLLLGNPSTQDLINLQDKNGLGRVPLHWSSQVGNLEICELLLKNNASLYICDDEGFFPLHIAASEGHISIIELILSHGGNVDLPCPAWENGTCLHNACAWGRDDIVSFLLDQGAEPHLADSQGRRPRDFALISGNLRSLELITQCENG
jgi:uncharacterized protein